MGWKKKLIGSVLGLQALWAISVTAHANEMFPSETPDTGRVPAVITLLKNTPFYDSYTESSGEPKGVLAPQDVSIVKASMPWYGSNNWWKVETWLGEKWILVQSSDMEAAPPRTITLMDETPMYAKPDEKLTPTGALSPQDVTVAGAQKQWFVESDYGANDWKWFKIQTTWLGEQWIRLPLSRIGMIRELDQQAYYLNDMSYHAPYIHPADQTNYTSENVIDKTVHITAEFIPMSGGSWYRIETVNGPKWMANPGMPVKNAKETVDVATRTTLFKQPYPYGEEIAQLDPQKVEAFQIMDQNPYTYNPDNQFPWYHVRTSKGEGWINRLFADPVGAQSSDVEIQLDYKTELMSYPTSNIWYKFASLSPQKVKPTAFWDDPNGTRWYQIDSYVGKAWFQLYPGQGKPLLPDFDKAVEAKFFTLYFSSAQTDGDKLTSENRQVGYKKGDDWFVSIPFVSEGFRYTVSGADKSKEGVTFESKTGYGFRVVPGSDEATVVWQGVDSRKVKLTKPAERSKDGVLYLAVPDIRMLFGASFADNESYVAFLLHAYNIEKPVPKPVIAGDKLELSVYLTDNLQQSNSEKRDRPVLVLYDRSKEGDAGVQAKETVAVPFIRDFKMFELKGALTLKPGKNELRAVLKIGERILWQYDFTAEAESAGK
ncbi:hypothetical protein [Paenibacillus sp. MBLB4367]|uniref:hypothetical protein n=1 Tax=Paenibacillus sp. MBLB4367 TaxID=3384767 RepID=UPI0039081DC5